MKKANQVINITRLFNTSSNGLTSPIETNGEVDYFLLDISLYFEEIMGQDTWVFEDGSYITKLEDDYFIGADIDMFELNN